MQKHAMEFSIKRMSRVFGVSRSGYYQFLHATPSRRAQEDERLLLKIKAIHQSSRETYGSPRIHAELREEGETCSRKRVSKIMRKSAIMAKMKRRFKVTTRANPKAAVAPNVLQQDFSAQSPNQRWVADFTYIDTREGWLYVATVLDLFSRRIVGLAMSDRMTDELVIAALEQALIHRQPNTTLTHHSDRGSQYTSRNFQNLLRKRGIIASMSGTGNCYDNSAMESFYHTLKTEHVYFEQYTTREEAKQSIFEYIEVFYNRQRKHSTLGYVSPMVYEKQWHQHTQAITVLFPELFCNSTTIYNFLSRSVEYYDFYGFFLQSFPSDANLLLPNDRYPPRLNSTVLVLPPIKDVIKDPCAFHDLMAHYLFFHAAQKNLML